MATGELFDESDLAGRGRHQRLLGRYLEEPEAVVPDRGRLYAAATVAAAEAEPHWREQMRLAFDEDADLHRRIAENETRWERVTSKPTALYRLFNAAGVLLYVGITTDPATRFKAHRSGTGKEQPKPWWPKVADKEIEWLGSRPEALAAEAFAVVTEHPLHNKAMADPWFADWFRHRWLDERLEEIGTHPRPQNWAALRRNARRVESHRVPHQTWWAPHPLCERRLAVRKADAIRDNHAVRDRAEPILTPVSVVRLTLWHRGECGQCRQPSPCATLRQHAARFQDHPQYSALWADPGAPGADRPPA